MTIQDQSTFRIVVGIDETAASRDALRWALDHAEEREDSVVEAVAAWEHPRFYGSFVPPALDHSHQSSEERHARQTLTDTVSDIGSERPDRRVRMRLGQGSPEGVLLAAAEDADLLVVGRQLGDGPLWRGLISGPSLMRGFVRRAGCPVIVVDGEGGATEAPESGHHKAAA